jgi:hypothetical protein
MNRQRLLATLVWVLTAVMIISVEVVLARVLITPHAAAWPFLGASGCVAAATAVYMRWLARRLHRNDSPRWRLAPAEATPLLPVTIGVSLLALGVATSTYWPDWVGSATGGCAVAALTEWWLQRQQLRI